MLYQVPVVNVTALWLLRAVASVSDPDSEIRIQKGKTDPQI